MTQDKIIELARQAGFDTDLQVFKDGTAIAIKLAKLIAEKEREACAKVADELVGQDLEHNFSALISHNIRARGLT